MPGANDRRAGTGKTVLLNRMHQDAEAKGLATVVVEAPEGRSLPALLAPHVRVALLKLDRMAAAGNLVTRALRALGGFIAGMKVKYEDVEFSVEFEWPLVEIAGRLARGRDVDPPSVTHDRRHGPRRRRR